MCLIFSEGLAQKAQKGLRLWRGIQANGLKATGWEFLDEYIALHKKREKGTKDTIATYMKDLVAGRPIFGHPGRSGGFRFRYGRSRAAGILFIIIILVLIFSDIKMYQKKKELISQISEYEKQIS